MKHNKVDCKLKHCYTRVLLVRVGDCTVSIVSLLPCWIFLSHFYSNIFWRIVSRFFFPNCKTQALDYTEFIKKLTILSEHNAF